VTSRPSPPLFTRNRQPGSVKPGRYPWIYARSTPRLSYAPLRTIISPVEGAYTWPATHDSCWVFTPNTPVLEKAVDVFRQRIIPDSLRENHAPRPSQKEVTMAARMKRRHRIGELVARLLDRRSGGTVPGLPSGQGPSGMNQQPRVRWADNSADIVGSPRNIQEKLSAYQARGWGPQETSRSSARSPEPALSSEGIANQEPSYGRAPTPSLRSPRSNWADKWQR
jgi:hypothetical protein